jgi:hypothetical protein
MCGSVPVGAGAPGGRARFVGEICLGIGWNKITRQMGGVLARSLSDR